MPTNTRKKIVRVRQAQLFLRICALLGSLGALFCVIAIKQTTGTVGWIIRAAPAITLVHTLYGTVHVGRAPTGRTPGSTASYMIFAALVDSGLLPFWVFSAWVAQGDYTRNEYGWSTLFNDSDLSYKIIYAFFLLSCVETGLIFASLMLDTYLAIKFKQISKLPPDMNPLEPNLTSRHKRNKSEITQRNMKNSGLAAAKRESEVLGSKRVPFIHTRTDSADSITLYGSEAARNSRSDLRKGLDENNKDPWRWSRNSSPERPQSALNPSPNSRSAGSGMDFRPERSSMLKEKPSRPSSWLSYLDYEGVPSEISSEANVELDREVRPISPPSVVSDRDASFDRAHQGRENWYSRPSARNSQFHLPPVTNQSSNDPHSHNGSRISLAIPPADSPAKKRSREPLAMNPPTPTRSHIVDENAYKTPSKTYTPTFEDSSRAILQDTSANSQVRPHATPTNSRPASFIGSGGKTRFYGNLRNSISGSPLNSPERSHSHENKDIAVGVQEVEDMYERTRTMQTESDYSANFEVYGSDEEDEKLSANIKNVTMATTATPPQWNGVRQASNSTGFDLNSDYAGLGSEFGRGMGRRRDVSGKVAEEGRASPNKNAAAGWQRFKGL